MADLFNTKLGSNDEDENNIDAYQELWDQRYPVRTINPRNIRYIKGIYKNN